MTAGTSVEADVARELGVDRARLGAVRREALLEGEHWCRGRKGRIEYTPAGVARLASALGMPEAEVPKDSPGSPEKNGGGANGGGGRAVELVVARVVPNPRLVLCWDERRRASIRCRVASNRNLCGGMPLYPCVPVVPGPPGAFEFRGQLPRMRGRWSRVLLEANRQKAARDFPAVEPAPQDGGAASGGETEGQV